MSRASRRVERIKEDIDIVDVLVRYGYEIMQGGGYREQQFSCDLHGDGFDGKPSARVYPESQSWYCFACDKTRDAIETVREKNGVGFMEALTLLERQFNLPDLPWEDSDYSPRQEQFQNPVAEYLSSTKSFEEEKSQVENFLNEVTSDRDLFMRDTLAFWEAYDMLCFRHRKGLDDEGKLSVAMGKLREKVIKRAIAAHQKSA